jgi:hypothetical protein
MDKKDKSLVNILNTVQNKIGIYDEMIKKDQSSLDNLQQLFSKDITTLTTRDLKEQPLSKLKRIIEAIEMKMTDFSNIDLTDYLGLEKLLNLIKGFIEVHKDRINQNESYLKDYNDFVEFLTNKNSKIVLTKDFVDKTNKIITTLGLLSEEKLFIQRLVANKIISLSKNAEITQKATYLHGYQTNDVELKTGFRVDVETLKNVILSEIKKNGNRIELHGIKGFAREIAAANNVSSELVENIIISILSDQEYKRFSETGASKHSDTIEKLYNMANSDKRIVIAETNRIIQGEIDKLRKVTFTAPEDIVVSDADNREEFDSRKQTKKLMIAYVIKEKLNEYDNNSDPEKDEEYEKLISQLCEEYMNTEHIEYVDRTR